MRIKINSTRGFSLIEMAIVLLITGLLVGGAYQLVTGMQQQRTDQASANEMRGIALALERFLSDHHASLARDNIAALGSVGRGAILSDLIFVNINGANLRALTYFQQNYLPQANLPSGYNLAANGYVIGIRNAAEENNRYLFKGVVLKRPSNTLSALRQGRIADMMGVQGGLVRNGRTGIEITGAQGSWRVVPAEYGFIGASAPVVGQLAALTASSNSQMSTNVFSRINTGNPEANTMRADLIMGNNTTNSQAYAVRNAAGLGTTRTSATVGQACGGAAMVDLLDESGVPLSPQRQVRADQFMIMN